MNSPSCSTDTRVIPCNAHSINSGIFASTTGALTSALGLHFSVGIMEANLPQAAAGHLCSQERQHLRLWSQPAISQGMR